MTNKNAMKNRKFYTEANRIAWNEAVKIHQAHRKDSLLQEFSKPGFSALDKTLRAELEAIGLGGKSIVHLCCNNGAELISTLNLGANTGVGFDISDEAIAEAKTLAKAAKSAAEFIRSDLYEIDNSYETRFDFAMFTIGGLCWLPDLPEAFKIAARLLREGGSLIIHDLHPFALMLAAPGEPIFKDPYKIEYSYFSTEPYSDNSGIDYVGHTVYEGATKYDFPHRLSDILTAAIEAGLRPIKFKEFPYDISDLFGHIAAEGKVPLSYFLEAKK